MAMATALAPHQAARPLLPSRHARGPRTLALLPAHDEADRIGAALASLHAQTDPPTWIVVVADNCTDDTADIAIAHGATVFVTHENSDKKAGALNQSLAHVLPQLRDDDHVLVMDADCTLDPAFLTNAAGYLARGYGAVGGIFSGDGGGGFVGHLQRNEYARYARDVARRGGRCLVVTGTAAAFRAEVLRHVSAARLTGRLPAGDGNGGVYDTTVLTEDNELTFALRHLAYRVISPPECTLVTEVMPDWRTLWRQRLRWKRGAVENCFQYGLTRVTLPYWGRQLLTAAGVLVSVAYLSTIAVALTTGTMHLHPFWLWVSLVFVVERVITVRQRGWRRMALAATCYELVLDYFLQACHAKAYFDAVFRRRRSW
jgi:cellulose synthase/poly-beta-1,6-N-acetylglucosamine synthase-like glycosyltransferase